MSKNIHHSSKGYGLRSYHKDICKQIVDVFHQNKKNRPEINPEDIQSLFELWENDGYLSDGTCMTFREYARTLIQPHIQKLVKRYYQKYRGPNKPNPNSKSEELWESFEDFLRDYMGDKYYNKI